MTQVDMQAPFRSGADKQGPRQGARQGSGRPWPRRARRGLANVLLTVAIVAIALVFLIGIYTSINSSIRTQTVQTGLTSLESEIRRSFANAPEYSDEAYHDFLAPRMPENLQRGDDGDEEIITPWGGEIEAGGGTTVGTAEDSPNRFWIHVAELPRDTCITLAESFLNRSSVVSVHVGDTAPGTAVENREAIETNCDGGDNDGVGIVFRG
ncbi:type 4 pilus major pilin [Ruegeria sp.]|uniref:type 4 pilus major pilin n=1 Tax=Ruegeria sp. TaxID=1879320 RepID=UPI003AFF8A59